MKLRYTGLKIAFTAALLAGSATQAFAASATAAGTTVSNTATINFSVGGVAQTAQNSNTATFLVDRRIDLVVANQDASGVTVVPGATGQVTTFKVTNNSNSTEDFSLAAAQTTGDNFDTTGVQVFVESNATAGYQAGGDTATFIDELAPGASVIVYVVANVPAGVVNGNVSNIVLTATAAQSVDANGQYVATVGSLAATAVATSGADTTSKVDTVFADVAGSTDAANDGKHSATDQYKVVTATIGVAKSSTVVSDLINGTTNPKAIPGATVEYCLYVSNTGSAAATSIVLTDAIPTNTTYVAGSIKTGATAGAGNTCVVGTGTGLTDANDADAADYNVTTAGAVTIKAASVAASGTFLATFRVTVN